MYEWGITLVFLTLAVIMKRVPRLQVYWKIASALFIASAANAVNLSLGNFLSPILHLSGEDMRFLAVDKLSQAIPIVLTIILLTLWSGDDLGDLPQARQPAPGAQIWLDLLRHLRRHLQRDRRDPGEEDLNPGLVRFRDQCEYHRQRNPLDIDVLFY